MPVRFRVKGSDHDSIYDSRRGSGLSSRDLCLSDSCRRRTSVGESSADGSHDPVDGRNADGANDKKGSRVENRRIGIRIVDGTVGVTNVVPIDRSKRESCSVETVRIAPRNPSSRDPEDDRDERPDHE